MIGRVRTGALRFACAAAATAAWAAPAFGQLTGAPAPGYRREAAPPSSTLPAPLREIGFDQHLDRGVPLDLVFRDEEGQAAPLGSYFGSRPVVLSFVYYACPMLCTQVLSSMAGTLALLSLEPGRDFEVVTLSIDPRETPALAAEKKQVYLQRYGRPAAAAGWHFLTGDEPAIRQLADAAGFRYTWDDDTAQYVHPAGVVVLTPDGRVSRYLFGLEYGARDLRLAIVEASAGAVGTAVDAVLLYCYHYDPMTGRYGLVIMRTLRIAGVATVVAIGTFIAVMLRRERRTRAALRSRHPAP